ncbi:ATPase P-type K/Mg/Cd/Cu/Zn/Na/Ca/Na/H-transporter [Penicillium maclennaniae]|uniref:ATPase P-type K/Mg/Cd/Cu/Zn/Na/Ca/Na/H-transporter n=1 Tax=Penicillium maclennaniae TaxID=1343394 RepID=UPI0025407231|nr:ATPase P-type K/Mg/Cd/Cu/Zn/Na/Ca/Na/H-transporter [Penicillium maclennaniae]KAJ5684210.1 ATPase P-type K/Mg/Cd/Cu/Zn/Na/Ca/Na/H-transporter [Penicillium maclennaniae]
MGIETLPEVEESTEPPICGLAESIATFPATVSSNLEPRDPIEKPTPASSHSVPPTNAQGAWLKPLETSKDQGNNAHLAEPHEIAALLETDLQNGISATEAELRLKTDGPNVVREIKGVSVWGILLRQVSNSLTIVLLITMALSFGIDDYIEGGVITAVILLNIVVGFFQDYRAEMTILSLHRLSAPICKVIRDGRVTSVKAESLVVGDIVRLAVGDIVPADLRLFDGMNASMDEALLTGESLPILKTPHTTFASPNISIGDRTNMAYSGCSTTQGRATGIVVAIGMATEVGKIAELLRDHDATGNESLPARFLKRFRSSMANILGLVGTPLQVKLSKFALLLFALAILLAIIVFSVNLWDVQGEVLIYGICVAVAVIPESLIAVLTITIAVGTKAMARGNVIVRKLQCLEAVGGVTNICSDKTGTLTQGKMIARSAWIPGAGTLAVHQTTDPYDPTSGLTQLDEIDWDSNHPIEHNPALSTFLSALALCNLSVVHHENGIWSALGEPTEIALHVLAMRFEFGRNQVIDQRKIELYTEYPFDSAIKKMSVVYRNATEGLYEIYTKGAPEAIIPTLSSSEGEAQIIRETADRMAGEGLRVLCIAYKKTAIEREDQVSTRSTAESSLQFGGLVGLYDPPRVETAGAVRKCQMAGITVHMLTGDHIKTATAIASEVGILNPVTAMVKPGSLVMTADEFDRLRDNEIDEIQELPLVIARCSPATKVRMVEAMHRRQAFCVMTGDGVNDSPALKRADVGIAMGKNGSDVAKEAADMVLTDDNFSSIVKAVEEGRRLFDNIQKFLMHLLISNIAQVILLLIALAFKDAGGDSVFPLSPLEILWANLVTSSFLAVGLGLEESQPAIMYRPPHDLRVGVFTRELIVDKIIYGTCMGSLCLLAFVCVIYAAGAGTSDLGDGCNQGYNSSCDAVFRARATTYATLTFLLLVTAWEVKHFSRSLFNMDPIRFPQKFSIFPTVWQNRFLFWAVIAGFVIAFPVIYLPVINQVVFKHHAITWEWGVVFGCTAVYLGCVESWKAIKRAFGIGSGKNNILTLGDAEMTARLGSTPMSMSANASIELK